MEMLVARGIISALVWVRERETRSLRQDSRLLYENEAYVLSNKKKHQKLIRDSTVGRSVGRSVGRLSTEIFVNWSRVRSDMKVQCTASHSLFAIVPTCTSWRVGTPGATSRYYIPAWKFSVPPHTVYSPAYLPAHHGG
jgi:hypothetical protein